MALVFVLLGILPWTTSIVFTKETLIRFLKQLEVEVDTNMSQVSLATDCD